MKLRSNAPRQTVVIDFRRHYIWLVATETAGEAVRFSGMTQILVPDEEVFNGADPAWIAERIRREVRAHGWSGYPAACLLSQSETSTQSFNFPPMPDEDLRLAIRLKLKDSLHFDAEDAAIDFRRIPKPEGAHRALDQVLAVAARRDAVDEALAIVRQAGLVPVAVGAASESLANLSHHACLGSRDEASIHIDLGAESTFLNLFDGRQLRFSREIDVSGEAFTQALLRPIITSEKVIHLTHEQAEEIIQRHGYPLEEENLELPHGVRCSDLLPLMEPVAQRLVSEVLRSIHFLNGLLGRSGNVRVVLSGSTGAMPKLDHLLEELLNTPVSTIDPIARAIAHWRLAIREERPAFASEFSAILGYSLGSDRPMDLLPPEERIREADLRALRVRAVSVACTLALIGCLAMGAVPISSAYEQTNTALQTTSDELDQHLLRRADAAARLAANRDQAERVRRARGSVPDWTWVLKELSTILPGAAQVTSLETHRQNGAVVLRLVARVLPDVAEARSVLTEMTLALNGSPFFDKVRVSQASVPMKGSAGRFDATCEIVTAPPGPDEEGP